MRHSLPSRGTHCREKVPGALGRVKEIQCDWRADRVEDNGMRAHNERETERLDHVGT